MRHSSWKLKSDRLASLDPRFGEGTVHQNWNLMNSLHHQTRAAVGVWKYWWRIAKLAVLASVQDPNSCELWRRAIDFTPDLKIAATLKEIQPKLYTSNYLWKGAASAGAPPKFWNEPPCLSIISDRCSLGRIRKGVAEHPARCNFSAKVPAGRNISKEVSLRMMWSHKIHIVQSKPSALNGAKSICVAIVRVIFL